MDTKKRNSKDFSILVFVASIFFGRSLSNAPVFVGRRWWNRVTSEKSITRKLKREWEKKNAENNNNSCNHNRRTNVNLSEFVIDFVILNRAENWKKNIAKNDWIFSFFHYNCQ